MCRGTFHAATVRARSRAGDCAHAAALSGVVTGGVERRHRRDSQEAAQRPRRNRHAASTELPRAARLHPHRMGHDAPPPRHGGRLDRAPAERAARLQRRLRSAEIDGDQEVRRLRSVRPADRSQMPGCQSPSCATSTSGPTGHGDSNPRPIPPMPPRNPAGHPAADAERDWQRRSRSACRSRRSRCASGCGA